MSFSSVLAKFSTGSSAKQLFYGVLVGIALSLTTSSVNNYLQERRRKNATLSFEPRPIELRSDEVVDGIAGLIGLFISTQCGNRNTHYTRQAIPHL